MITPSKHDSTRFIPYREVVGMYMEIIQDALKENNFPDDIVMAKTGTEKDVNRAPLVIAKRGTVTPSPDTIGLSEEIIPNIGFSTSITGHILNYVIIFESFGNSYAEAENIGNIILEIILTTGQSPIQSLHESISGARLSAWGETTLVESSGEKHSNIISVNVFLILGGSYNFK